MSPVFENFYLMEKDEKLVIKFDNCSNKKVILNLPILENVLKIPKITLFVDNKPLKLFCNTKIKNQYGWCNVFKSKISNGKEWVLSIE